MTEVNIEDLIKQGEAIASIHIVVFSLSWYPDRESNSELSFRRALLYPFNYQGDVFGYKGSHFK